MINQGHTSGNSSGDGWFSSLIHSVLSYYSNLISNPFKSGLAYFIIGMVPMLIIGWLVLPSVLYSEQQQPLNFNHALHMESDVVAGLKDYTEAEKCLYCHSFREDGSFTGIPRTETCAKCHKYTEYPLGETAEEELLMKEYISKGKEVPWLAYYRQPDCVYFPHIAHVKMGKLECTVCHGAHGKSYTLPVYEKNRISTYSRNIWGKNIAGHKTNTWDRMKMDDCAECHTEKGHEENNACFVCHK